MHGACTEYGIKPKLYLNQCEGEGEAIPVTVLLVAMYNACYAFQRDSRKNLLLLALGRLDLYWGAIADKALTATLSELLSTRLFFHFLKISQIASILTKLQPPLLLKSDCLSWYVSDASLIIAKCLAELKDAVKKDRGSPGVYHEMIQTWVTYELVKVTFIFGLNPSPNDSLNDFAPETDNYIAYLRMGDEDKEHMDDTKAIHELLMKHTLHTGVFHK
jgi:hypothetical protein